MADARMCRGFWWLAIAVAGVLCACAPRGGTVVDLSISVVELHRNSVSHDGALEALGPREEFAELRAGKRRGRRHQVIFPDGRIWRTSILGQQWIREGFDGQVAWRQERGRPVTILREDRAEALRLEAALLSHLYFLDPVWSIAEGGGAELDGLPHDVVDVRGPDGLEMELLLDRAETLIRQARWGHPRRRTQVDWHDFRNVASVPLPHRTRVIGADGELSSQVTHVQPYEGDDHIFDVPHDDVPARHWLLDGDRALGIALDAGQDGWTVNVGVGNQEPRPFVLDLGRSSSVIFDAVPPEEGATWSVDLKIEGMRWSHPAIEVESWPASPWGGALGCDFFDAFVVVLDPLSGLMDVHDPTVFHYEGGGAWMPIHWVDGEPRIIAMVGDQEPARLSIGLAGGGGSGLSRSFVDAHGIPVAGASVRIYGRPVKAPLPILEASSFDGRLGPDAWSDFRLIFDLPRGGAWIESPF